VVLFGLLDTDPEFEGLILIVSVYWICVKLATTLFGPFIVMVAGFVEPERFPDQPLKLYPGIAVAVIWTLWPLLYQFVPDGLTVPPPDDPTEVVRVY
jgi:hypothetical protein